MLLSTNRRLTVAICAIFMLPLPAASAPELVAAPASAALVFTHSNGSVGELYFPEMTGQGAGALDYDGDGDQDLYLVQGAELEDQRASDSGDLHDLLLRNDRVAEGVQWVDVTERSGISAEGYGMAVASGDFDGDGLPDLFVGNYGANQLWRNRGDGTFEPATQRLVEDDPRWTTAAIFIDYDLDGRQDLYVVNYVDYSLDDPPACYAASSRRDYCGPSGFTPQHDRLLHNVGGGVFEDVSASSGITAVAGSGLGIGVLDVEGDGRLELYVANDGQPNFLWRTGGGRWLDDALLAGVAVNRRGEPEASMGVAVGDVDRDGDEDFVVTHLDGETHTLYINQGDGLFDDRSRERGLAAATIRQTGFGVVWADLDHDGWLDLAVANGAVRIQERTRGVEAQSPLAQSNQLFVSRRGELTELPGTAFSQRQEVSRGLVRVDLDNDGDHDLLVTNNAGPARLFLDDRSGGSDWIGLSFGSQSYQRVLAGGSNGERSVVRASSAGSYASAADARVLVTGVAHTIEISHAQLSHTVRLLAPPGGRYLRFP